MTGMHRVMNENVAPICEKHPHFEPPIKGFLIGISLKQTLLVYGNHISSIQIAKCGSTKCGSYENYEIKVVPHVPGVFPKELNIRDANMKALIVWNWSSFDHKM